MDLFAHHPLPRVEVSAAYASHAMVPREEETPSRFRSDEKTAVGYRVSAALGPWTVMSEVASGQLAVPDRGGFHTWDASPGHRRAFSPFPLQG